MAKIAIELRGPESFFLSLAQQQDGDLALKAISNWPVVYVNN